MSFLAGRATFRRFALGTPRSLNIDDLVKQLAANAAGKQRIANADGSERGWTAGDSILDTAFSPEKNFVDDCLCFEFRTDTNKPPKDLFKAYYQVELKALSANNPSGFASAKQKKEAKETAIARLEDEAKDGRFIKRKCVPVLWDFRRKEVLFGATSASQIPHFCDLFRQTFGLELEPISAGTFANQFDGSGHSPTAFLPGLSSLTDFAWIPSEDSLDWLGNEFLLWLWYQSDIVADTIKLPDRSELTFMIARSLVLDCPRGQTGIDGFKHEGPSRLPEAKRALRAGKLPRKCGLTVVRHDAQFEFALLAEDFAVGSAKLPKCEDDTPNDRRVERMGLIRDLIAGIDLTYQTFLALRLSAKWDAEAESMREWLGEPEAAEMSSAD